MSKSRVGLLLSLITVLTTLLTLVGSAPRETTARADGVSKVLLSWEWELSAYRLASVVGDDGRTYTRVEAEGLGALGVYGVDVERAAGIHVRRERQRLPVGRPG